MGTSPYLAQPFYYSLWGYLEKHCTLPTQFLKGLGSITMSPSLIQLLLLCLFLWVIMLHQFFHCCNYVMPDIVTSGVHQWCSWNGQREQHVMQSAFSRSYNPPPPHGLWQQGMKSEHSIQIPLRKLARVSHIYKLWSLAWVKAVLITSQVEQTSVDFSVGKKKLNEGAKVSTGSFCLLM